MHEKSAFFPKNLAFILFSKRIFSFDSSSPQFVSRPSAEQTSHKNLLSNEFYTTFAFVEL
jgi:hypothetical protein